MKKNNTKKISFTVELDYEQIQEYAKQRFKQVYRSIVLNELENAIFTQEVKDKIKKEVKETTLAYFAGTNPASMESLIKDFALNVLDSYVNDSLSDYIEPVEQNATKREV